MAKIHLTADRVTRLLKGAVLEIDGKKVGGGPGRFRDAEVRGLLLCVAESKSKRRDDAKAGNAAIKTVYTGNWVIRYQLHGCSHDMGLGSVEDFKLAAARERARAVRLKLAHGIDPLEERRAAEAEAKAARTKMVTFKEAAIQFFNKAEKEWRSARSRQQFLATMEEYVYPVLGGLSVDAVTKDLVLRCVEPLWTEKTVTMSRIRSRIEQVLAYAAARGLRSPNAENPAAWSHLKFLLAKPSKVTTVQHHPAMPYREVPEFLAKLRKCEGPVHRALEFLILTAARSGEVRDAVWSEIDIANGVWTIPASRMKANREHRVALSSAATEILRDAYRLKDCPYVFVGANGQLGSVALPNALRRLAPNVTLHGFRSSFRDWAAESTAFPNPIIELCLAHKVSTAVEASYLRSDLIDKRARLMQAWCDFCASPLVEEGAVIPLRAMTTT